MISCLVEGVEVEVEVGVEVEWVEMQAGGVASPEGMPGDVPDHAPVARQLLGRGVTASVAKTSI
jgi:hypothetical protein